MSRMTMIQVGVILFAVCLLTQVVSAQNSTDPTSGGNSTSNPNITTTMATGTYSSSANTTSPIGAGLSVHPGTFTLLLPITMAATLLLLCSC